MGSNAVVMVVDDDAQLRSLVGTVLARAGHDVVEAADGEEALRLLDEKLPDLILTDMAMPKMDGSQLIEEVHKRDPMLPMIVLTGLATVDAAVEMMRKGACDFIAKPFKIDQLSDSVKKALGRQLFRRDVLRLRSEQCVRLGEAGATLIGASPKMIAVYRMLKQVAHSPTTTVLIQGESGTGKELIARAIHLASDRREKCFMDINCAALTESLLEAEIFGYEKGAFTGAASSGKPGLFEVANDGTVFLDEIGEMSLPLQAKLLRVLQEKRFKRVGGVVDVEVDIRIIASTNRDLETLVQEGKFRLDLYYRLRVIPILIPPLRDRKEDIIPIAQHYVEFFGASLFKRVTEPDRRGARSPRGVLVAGQRPRAAQRHRARRDPLRRRPDRPRIAPLRRRAAVGRPADGKRHRGPLHRRNGKAPHQQGPRKYLLAQDRGRADPGHQPHHAAQQDPRLRTRAGPHAGLARRSR